MVFSTAVSHFFQLPRQMFLGLGVTCNGIPFSVFLCLLVFCFLFFVVVVVVVVFFFTAGNTKGSITGFKSSHVTLPTYEKVLLTQLPYPASLIGSCFFVELLEYSDDRHPWENLEAKLNDIR